LFALVLLSIIVCIIKQITFIQLFTQINYTQYFWFGLSGLIGLSIGDYYTFNAFRILGSRRTTLFNCFAPAAALVTGIYVIKENIGLTGIFGMCVSISGIMLLTLSKKEQQAVNAEGYGNFRNGVFAGIMSAICQGVGLVCAKKGFLAHSDLTMSAVHATWIRMLSAVMFSYAIGIFKTNIFLELKQIAVNTKNLYPVLTGTIFGPVIGVSLSLFAAQSIPVSIAQTILSMVPLSVMIAGVIFYKEKVSLQGIIALMVSMAGVIILTLY